MSGNAPESSSDEEQNRMQKKKKRLYTPRTRAKRIVTAGPSQDPQAPTAESELLDFRNRIPPPMTRDTVPVLSTNPLRVSSEYDASCESLDLKTSDHESRDNPESDGVLTTGGIRCQERITNDDPQEGLPPTVDAHMSFDAGYLASSDSFSTSDIQDVVARYTGDPDVSRWTQNKNPEIRIHYQITYDQPLANRMPAAFRAVGSTTSPFWDTNDATALSKAPRLYYREVGATSSGGSVIDSSVSTKQEQAIDDSRSDAVGNRNDVVYDEAFEDMLISRIQNRIHELGGAGGLELNDDPGLTPAGRQIKQRFGFLMRDFNDEEDEAYKIAGTAGSTERSRPRRRRRRRTPDWMLTDAPSDETLRPDLNAPPSTVSLGLDDGPSEPPPPRYSRSPDSESEVSALRAIRAEGGDQFVEAVLWRLHENLRAGHNFREYRQSTAGKPTYTRRLSHHETSSEDDSDAASSRSSIGHVQFKDRVLVRPLGRDPLLTEYRRPYSKVSRQKLHSIKDYKPEPDDPDYEDSLKDKTEPSAGRPPVKGAPATTTPATPPSKPQPGWKRLFCCISAGSAKDATAAEPAAAEAAPPSAEAEAPPPSPAPPSPEPKRKRRRVKPLPVQELDTDITNEELRSLHLLFDDRVELCSLSEPSTEASLDDPSELSDPESDAEPCFSDFLKACGLKEDKINEYLKFYKTHKGVADSGHGDWAATRRSPDGRPASVSSTDDPSWWDKRARERRHELRRCRREHREYQRQLDTQRDLEVEGQLRRALETQRELLREREVEREIERTRESSKERKELRLEEEVLEKELLRRLLAELQHEQVRSREREKRRTVARILEEELITRLTLALARQRERSEERRGQHDAQRIEEEASTRELKNRIEELRMRIEENKILRDYERDEEQERLKLLEELLVKERRRMEILEESRLQEQDQETKTREILTELEEKSCDDEERSQKDYEYCAKTLLKKNELHKAMRQKLTTEIRKRELVKRKLVSLSDIEKTNPRLFQLAKVMEEVTDEKGCLQLEYAEPGIGILKKDLQAENEVRQEGTEGNESEVREEGREDAESEVRQQGREDGENTDGEGRRIKTEGVDADKTTASAIKESTANIKEEPPDEYTEHAPETSFKTEDSGQVIVGVLKTEVHVAKPEPRAPEDTGGETDLDLPRQDGASASNEDVKPPVPQSEVVVDSQPPHQPSDAEAPPQAEEEPPVPTDAQAPTSTVEGGEELGEVAVMSEGVEGEMEDVDGAEPTTEMPPTETMRETVKEDQHHEGEESPSDLASTPGAELEPPEPPTEAADLGEPTTTVTPGNISEPEPSMPPTEAAGPSETSAAPDDAQEPLRFRESGVQVNEGRFTPKPGSQSAPAVQTHDSGQTDSPEAASEDTAEKEPGHSDPQEGTAQDHEGARGEKRHPTEEGEVEAALVKAADPEAAEVGATRAGDAGIAEARVGTADSGETEVGGEQVGVAETVAETAVTGAEAEEAPGTEIEDGKASGTAPGEEYGNEERAEQTGETRATAADGAAQEPVPEEPQAAEVETMGSGAGDTTGPLEGGAETDAVQPAGPAEDGGAT